MIILGLSKTDRRAMVTMHQPQANAKDRSNPVLTLITGAA